MKGDIVPDTDHVTRLCGGAQINEDGLPEATAFLLRVGEEFLSVNWLEHLSLANRDEEIAEVLRVLGTKRKVGATAKLALLNVGAARIAVREGTDNALEITCLHEPENEPPIDASHSGFYNLPLPDVEITAAERLVSAISKLYDTR